MNKIERMLQELCPNGVEYFLFGEVCEYVRGITYNKSQEAKTANEDAWRVFRANNITLSSNTLNYEDIKLVSKSVKVKETQLLRQGDILICAGSGSKEHIGKVAYIPTNMNYTFGGFMAVIRCLKKLNSRYLFHILASEMFSDYLSSVLNSSTINNLNAGIIKNFLIPVPPLPIQEEIVRILDHFTELAASLQAELQARKEQYEYYRNKLLTFDKIGGGTQSVTWMKMSELFDIRNGYTPSKANAAYWENGAIPWFRMEDIRQNGRILSDSIQHITPSAVKGGRLFPANSFIIATTATIGEHALIIVDSLANQRFTNLQVRKSLSDKIVVKFLYYYMFIVGEWCKNNTNVSGFASVDMSKFKKLLIPIPSISEQQRIVGILDKFETLVNDLSQGLPAEIAAVQEQYEYYRDKLLTFKRIA